MDKLSNCPNCNSDLNSEIILEGRLTILELYSERQVKLINAFTDSQNETYCSKCGYLLYQKATELAKNKISELEKNIASNLNAIPIITTHTPLKWNYDILGIVTGQSTIGTGVFTEITSSFSDLFGIQSERHNEKLQLSEENCFLQLRVKALNLGGNAIIATDIDYSEVGNSKGLLMICASGTAICLNNLDELNIINSEKLLQLNNLNYQLQEIKKLLKIY